MPNVLDRATISQPKSLHVRRPGQYCYINIPEISVMEWHPFSITSSPYDDFISFHIEAAGDWTKALQSIICALIDGVSHMPCLIPELHLLHVVTL